MRIPVTFQETLAPPDDAHVDEASLPDRLRAFSRLLAIAADEIAAMERGNVAQRRELCAERAALAAELLTGSADSPTHASAEEPAETGADDGIPAGRFMADRLPGSVAELLTDVIGMLDRCDHDERCMHDRWLELEGDALRAAHGADGVRARPAGHYLPPPPLDTRVDVRF